VRARGGHRHGNLQFFECLNLQDAAEKTDHALVAGESIARQGPAGEGFEADTSGNLLQLGNGDATAVSGSDESADAGACDQADGDVFLFEDFQNPDMGDAPGKAPAQRQPDAWLRGGFLSGTTRQPTSESLHRTNDLAQTLHRNPRFSRPALVFQKPLLANKMPAFGGRFQTRRLGGGGNLR